MCRIINAMHESHAGFGDAEIEIIRLRQGVAINRQQWYIGSFGETESFVFETRGIYAVRASESDSQHAHDIRHEGFFRGRRYNSISTISNGIQLVRKPAVDSGSSVIPIASVKYLVTVYNARNSDRFISVRVNDMSS